MIEKRFRYYEHKGADYILDNPNESLDFIEMLGDCLEAEEVVDLLNTLHEENEKLKRRNKGLQSELQIFKEDVKHSNLQINKLADENEQLKQLIKKVLETTPIEHSLAIDLKNNIRELYE